MINKKFQNGFVLLLICGFYAIPYYESLKSIVGGVKSVILFTSICVCLPSQIQTPCRSELLCMVKKNSKMLGKTIVEDEETSDVETDPRFWHDVMDVYFIRGRESRGRQEDDLVFFVKKLKHGSNEDESANSPYFVRRWAPKLIISRLQSSAKYLVVLLRAQNFCNPVPPISSRFGWIFGRALVGQVWSGRQDCLTSFLGWRRCPKLGGGVR
ncbi:putative squalene monooxygenase-like [Capsicum annuum]|nr:putative squalene monooxygenase-like [Capsicum annuum]KAF3672801.1 putative squalene monooxygenase-like [Capsicum annuum]